MLNCLIYFVLFCLIGLLIVEIGLVCLEECWLFGLVDLFWLVRFDNLN